MMVALVFKCPTVLKVVPLTKAANENASRRTNKVWSIKDGPKQFDTMLFQYDILYIHMGLIDAQAICNNCCTVLAVFVPDRTKVEAMTPIARVQFFKKDGSIAARQTNQRQLDRIFNPQHPTTTIAG